MIHNELREYLITYLSYNEKCKEAEQLVSVRNLLSDGLIKTKKKILHQQTGPAGRAYNLGTHALIVTPNDIIVYKFEEMT